MTSSIAANSAQPLLTEPLLAWFDVHGRRDLPWQTNPTPYRVWVSEIMLQQTQVTTVIPYYQRFMTAFPDVNALAAAPLDTVLHLWSGLGYYARARNLHKAAVVIATDYDGQFPNQVDALEALPGIGRSTAGAIVSLAYNQPAPILDGNVKRVLTRYHAVTGWPGKTQVAKQLWQLAESHSSLQRPAAYTQAIMDLGATVCSRRKPTCEVCPLQRDCRAEQLGTPEAFPTPQPKRHRPTKHQSIVVVKRQDGAVLLERRPETGVWGGMWSFPELAEAGGVAHWSDTRLGTTPLQVQQLKPLQHAFTHFDLVLEPVLVTVSAEPRGVMDREGWLWYKHASDLNRAVGLPAPVRSLLDSTLKEFQP